MHKHLNIIPVRHSRGKEDRIRGLEPFYRNGLIFHPPGGADALEDQLKRFPSGKHDDMIDALATAVYLAQKPNTGISANIMKQTGIQYTRDGKPFIPNN